MRALGVLLVLSLATTGCFHRRAKFPRALITTTYVGTKRVRKRAPPPRVALDNHGADGVLVTEDRFTFLMPATWRARGPDVFEDPSGRHVVTIAAYDKELEPEGWASAYYPSRKSWPATNGVFVLSAAQITALIVASDTDLFEVTCAQSDVSKDVPNAVCRDVLNSFRLR